MRQRKEIREESGVKNEGNRSGLEKQQIMAVSSSEEQNYELGVGNSLLPSPASLRLFAPSRCIPPSSYLSIQPLSLSFTLLLSPSLFRVRSLSPGLPLPFLSESSLCLEFWRIEVVTLGLVLITVRRKEGEREGS